jgi:predicted HTH domain antitoxin
VGEVAVKLPEEISSVIKTKEEEASEQITKLIALELCRERVISGGKAAEIPGMSQSSGALLIEVYSDRLYLEGFR